VLGFNANGGYAEYARLPAVNAVRVPDHVTLEHAAVAQPWGSASRAPGPAVQSKRASRWPSSGAGPVGLARGRCQGIRLPRHRHRHRPHRLEVAGKLGADLIINPAAEDVVER